MKAPDAILFLAVSFAFSALPMSAYSRINDVDEDLLNPRSSRDESRAGRFSLSFNAGASVPVGAGSLATGVFAEIAPYFNIISGLSLGLMVQYNAWDADGDALVKELNEAGAPGHPFSSASGSVSCLIIAPALRFQSNNKEGSKGFAALSFGFCRKNSSMSWTSDSWPYRSYGTSDTTISGPGLSINAGLLFPFSPHLNISFGAGYYLVFTEGDNTIFIDPKAGLLFIF